MASSSCPFPLLLLLFFPLNVTFQDAILTVCCSAVALFDGVFFPRLFRRNTTGLLEGRFNLAALLSGSESTPTLWETHSLTCAPPLADQNLHGDSFLGKPPPRFRWPRPEHFVAAPDPMSVVPVLFGVPSLRLNHQTWGGRVIRDIMPHGK